MMSEFNKNNVSYLLILILVAGACGKQHVSSGDEFHVVELPDGSSVFMNKHSTISYQEDFLKHRTVTLKGEAYFIVNKGKTPFHIKAGPGEIEIKGTELNVSTEDDKLEVEVDEGEVQLRANNEIKLIASGEKVAFSHSIFTKSIGKREFKIWMDQLERDLRLFGKKTGNEIEKGSRKAEKKFKKLFN